MAESYYLTFIKYFATLPMKEDSACKGDFASWNRSSIICRI